jgi:hypothetical protein
MLLRNTLLLLLFILYSIQSSLYVQHRGEVKPLDILFETGDICFLQKNDSIPLTREVQMQCLKPCLHMQVGINYLV